MNDINKKSCFVTTGKDLKNLGYTIENRPVIKLNSKEIPSNLHYLTSLAEYWGINDDTIRYNLIKQSSTESLMDLIETVCQPDVEERLDEWLAGPEAEAEDLSEAYIAFTALRLAADEAQSFLSKINQ